VRRRGGAHAGGGRPRGDPAAHRLGRGVRPRGTSWHSPEKARTAATGAACAGRFDGREIARTLYHKAASLPSVTFAAMRPHRSAAGRWRVRRVVHDAKTTSDIAICARGVLLATGGWERVSEYHQSAVATAMAWRWRTARRGDRRYRVRAVSPHRALRGGAPRFLLSEAMRGEGGTCERRWRAVHGALSSAPGAAPRDVVARAIVAEMKRTGAAHVFLDLTHREPDSFAGGFRASTRRACGMVWISSGSRRPWLGGPYAMGACARTWTVVPTSGLFAAERWPRRASTAPTGWPAIPAGGRGIRRARRDAPCGKARRPTDGPARVTEGGVKTW